MMHLFDTSVHTKDYDCMPVQYTVCHILLKPTPKIFGIPHMKWSLGITLNMHIILF